MRRRLTFILLWGGISLFTSVTLLLILVITGRDDYWLVPALGVGLPTIGLALALRGIIPGTRAHVNIFVRLLPPKCGGVACVEAARIRSGLYRIVSQNPGNLPWEFLTGETVQCSECVLPGGESGLIAIIRI
jgi:hypothetical protein